MTLKFTLGTLLILLLSSNLFSQVTLSTTTPDNGSGGVFLRLTTNTTSVTVQKFNTYFASANGTSVSIEVYSRDGGYTGFTTSNAGWTLLGTVSATSAGTTSLATINITSLSVGIAAASVKSFYLHAITTGGGIRYTGTTAAPPVTTWTDANLELFSNTTRTGVVAFGGTQFSPRTFAGSVEYTPAIVPVKWLHVYAKNQNGMAQLSWLVEETGVSNYQVEKQTDNGYITIATINSKGDGRNSYTTADGAAFVGDKKTVIYRIKQKDKDGRVNYSPVVMVRKTADNAVSIYPNPFTSSIQITSALKQTATISNVSGKIITILKLANGTNAIDAQTWLPGIYLLKTEAGGTVKIIKQ